LSTLLLLALLLIVLTSGSSNTTPQGVGYHGDSPHARVVVTEFANGDTIHVAPSIIVNNTYRTVARPPYINALESTTPEGR
jgi:hypothetical protein